MAAYAVAIHDEMVLLTKLSHVDPDAGRWTLPGGGLDFGEDPEDALHREVYEETGLRGDVEAFLGVDSQHRPPDGQRQVHEMHAIRLVYRMRLSGDPRVLEVGGTTETARWVALADVADLPRIELVDTALTLADVQLGR